MHIQLFESESDLAIFQNFPCYFPLFGVAYSELLSELWASKAIVKICSTPRGSYGGAVEVGMSYDRAFVCALPKDIDDMG